MAAPIKFEPPRRDVHAELHDRLEQAPAEHAAALLAVYDLLQGLHDRGVLAGLKGVVSASDFILEEAVETANTPENIRAIRNLLLLSKLLGGIDPDVLARLAGVIPEGISEASAKKGEAPGLFALLRRFNSEDCRRGMAFTATLLESLGKKLGEPRTGGSA
jgi:uncharacterized protein YjgD (DUF1641 family)